MVQNESYENIVDVDIIADAMNVMSVMENRIQSQVETIYYKESNIKIFAKMIHTLEEENNNLISQLKIYDDKKNESNETLKKMLSAIRILENVVINQEKKIADRDNKIKALTTGL